MHGAAWSVPTVAIGAAAPALALTPSLCPAGKYTMNWSYGAGLFASTPSGAPGTNGYSTWTWKPTVLQGIGAANAFTVTATSTYSNAVGTSPSLTMRGTTGGSSTSGVTMGQTASSASNSACFTFTFSQPLVNVAFSIGDIDIPAHERVTISPAPDGQSYNTATIAGSGTATDPWRGLAGDFDLASDHRGSVDVTYASLSSFTVCMFNLTPSWSSNMTLSSMIFDCPTWV